ncbi:MAG: HipA domain-containing protein [Rhodospirillaceae bacterium]|nr:HipA domain-containing protein [Rhodospirillaceae bacterium]MDD9998044.1 HipA domain-containing protein [Rhodospirillaceae bacterium]MDE0361743.1 HipA domain-containing protein [Rhodospirillaceae bacterium]
MANTSSGDSYPIINVDPDWTLQPEAMGGKRKFWYREPEQNADWLFKYPRENTGEHWAEKVAAEIAARLRVLHGRVELARVERTRGTATKSFTNGRQLFHGNQLLMKKVADYDADRVFGQSDHTLTNIWRVMDDFQGTDAVHRAKCRFAGFLVLDAVVGNTDRHHENWGLLLKRTETGWKGQVAPSFDHASSLGRELQDSARDRILEQRRVGRYSERGRGGIYWSEGDRRGLSPLELVRRAVSNEPELFRPVSPRLRHLNDDTLRDVVGRVPSGWISPSARQFAVELMRYNLAQLREVVR